MYYVLIASTVNCISNMMVVNSSDTHIPQVASFITGFALQSLSLTFGTMGLSVVVLAVVLTFLFGGNNRADAFTGHYPPLAGVPVTSSEMVTSKRGTFKNRPYV